MCNESLKHKHGSSPLLSACNVLTWFVTASCCLPAAAQHKAQHGGLPHGICSSCLVLVPLYCRSGQDCFTVKTDMQETQTCLWSGEDLRISSHTHAHVCANVGDGAQCKSDGVMANIWSLNRYVKTRRGKVSVCWQRAVLLSWQQVLNLEGHGNTCITEHLRSDVVFPPPHWSSKAAGFRFPVHRKYVFNSVI